MSLDWFEFHPKKFITDTLRLSTEAKGAYLMLMLDYYEKEAPAPDDDDVLAAICGLSIETWRRHRRVIEPLFAVADGLWRHVKCEEVIADRNARHARKSKAGKENIAKRWNSNKDTAGTTTGKATAFQPNTNGNTVVEANFGTKAAPSNQSNTSGTTAAIPYLENKAVVSPPVKQSNTSAISTGIHKEQSTEEEEGATAPSSAGGLSIGTLLDPNFTPANEVVARAIREDGVKPEELSGWLDDWKQRCVDDGARLANWHAAWDREYHRRMIERAAKKPKPRVAVSKPPAKSKTKGHPIPPDWVVTPQLAEFARSRGVNPDLIEQELRNYCANPAGMNRYTDHDAAFRTFVLKRISNGQAQTTQRRAPGPSRGGSILDAVDRLDAQLAARDGSFAEDQPDDGPPVLSLPKS